MSKTVHGIIRGRTIELSEDLGLTDGQGVEVQVKPVEAKEPWGEGIRLSAGCMADDPDFEAVMEEIYRARKVAPAHAGPRMTHLLDTNICSAHMKRPAGLAHRFIQYAGGLAIASVTLGELYAGAYKLPNPAKLLSGVADLLNDVVILDFDSLCAEQYGLISGPLLRVGVVVPVADLMIAAVALTHDLTLVTHNTADYQNIPGLRLDDWLTP